LQKDPSSPFIDALFSLFSTSLLDASPRVLLPSTATMTVDSVLHVAEQATHDKLYFTDATKCAGFQKLHVQLKPHQLHGLNMLLERELQPDGILEHFYQRINVISGGSLTFNKTFQTPERDSIPIVRSSILADDAGCGKTIQRVHRTKRNALCLYAQVV
jgi:SNF2 family DNA or RNA helicase